MQYLLLHELERVLTFLLAKQATYEQIVIHRNAEGYSEMRLWKMGEPQEVGFSLSEEALFYFRQHLNCFDEQLQVATPQILAQVITFLEEQVAQTNA